MAILNILTTLKENWVESIQLLCSKQFWLINIKVLKDSYGILLRHFWWLLAITFFIDYAIFPFFFRHNTLVTFLLNSLGTLLWFAFVLIIRSSIVKKDFTYYVSYTHYFLVFLMLEFAYYQSILTLRIGGFLILLIIVGMLPFFCFFYLDNNLSLKNIIKSLFNSLKMYLYTLPGTLLFIIMCVIPFFLYLLLSGVIITKYNLFGNDFLSLVGIVLYKILISFYIVVMNTIYIKNIHEHYELYK